MCCHLQRPPRQSSTLIPYTTLFRSQAKLFGQTLNHLGGFRLQTYKHRGWEDVLKEPLEINRMKKETLDAMWTAITNNKQPFVSFLQRKAEILGLEDRKSTRLNSSHVAI